MRALEATAPSVLVPCGTTVHAEDSCVLANRIGTLWVVATERAVEPPLDGSGDVPT